jgi:hypothetical protein
MDEQVDDGWQEMPETPQRVSTSARAVVADDGQIAPRACTGFLWRLCRWR